VRNFLHKTCTTDATDFRFEPVGSALVRNSLGADHRFKKHAYLSVGINQIHKNRFGTSTAISPIGRVQLYLAGSQSADRHAAKRAMDRI
jgi:hypothetical protein